jgi:hypothetical protein
MLANWIWMIASNRTENKCKTLQYKVQDIQTTIGGTHSFDQVMNYNVKFDVQIFR